MKRLFALLFVSILALGSLTSYIVLTEQVTAGREKIANGQKQLEDGQKMLAQGKAKLSAGKQKLSGAKNIYNGINTVAFLGLASKLPISSEFFKVAKRQIDDGNGMVARGSEKIRAGEKQLAEGQQDLDRGMKRLTHANIIRLTFGGSAIFFGCLALLLGFCWRRKLLQ
ncbi:MAG: hypothetical protein V4501_04040 [Pseudomonadota bacterium]